MSSSDCFRQQTNPDISGVGIRISFYLQNFILVLLVNRSWEDAPNSLWTFIATNFGLTIAALAQLKGDELTLFEAIEVSYLIWLANFGTFLALASYSGQKEKYKARRWGTNIAAPKHDNFVMVGAVVQTFFSIILTLVMWVKASDIGKLPDQECNNDRIRFVIFAVPVHALTTGRIIALVFTSLIFLGYSFMTYREIMASRRAMKALNLLSVLVLRRPMAKNIEPASSEPLVPNIQLGQTPVQPDPNALSSQRQRTMNQVQSGLLTVPTLPLQQTASTSTTSTSPKTTAQENQPEPRGSNGKRRKAEKSKTKDRLLQQTTTQKGRKNWVEYDRTLVGTFATQLLVFTYFIVCNELYINGYNNSDGENRQWGFGQVFALIVIVPSMVSVVRAFHKHGLRRLDRQENAANSAV